MTADELYKEWKDAQSALEEDDLTRAELYPIVELAYKLARAAEGEGRAIDTIITDPEELDRHRAQFIKYTQLADEG